MASFDPRSEELEMCPQANVFAATSPSTSAQIKAFMRRGFSYLGDLRGLHRRQHPIRQRAMGSSSGFG
jgi:hypothetical protein